MTAPFFQVRPAYSSDLPIVACPVRASLGVLGRKWALPVLRDVAHRSRVRFSDILHNNPGMTPRALSLTLRELQADGLIERRPDEDAKTHFYDLTPRGIDVVPVLTALISFSIRHLPHEVFADGKARSLDEMAPASQDVLLRDLARYAREGARRKQARDERAFEAAPPPARRGRAARA